MIVTTKNLAARQLGFLILSSALILQGCISKPKSKPCPNGLQDVSLSRQKWKVEYAGYGKIIFANNQISMRPKAVADHRQTHASLVLSQFEILSDSFEISVDYKNLSSSRKGNPNPWEVFWLLFNYVPGAEKVKTANYVVAKPNGFEVGRLAKLVDQAFVKTAESPHTSFNQWQRIYIAKSVDVLKVYFNDNFVFDIPTAELFTAHGKIGLYAEDAHVVIQRVCLKHH